MTMRYYEHQILSLVHRTKPHRFFPSVKRMDLHNPTLCRPPWEVHIHLTSKLARLDLPAAWEFAESILSARSLISALDFLPTEQSNSIRFLRRHHENHIPQAIDWYITLLQ